MLEHAMAVMLDCLGHILPFISPGTEMDVGQALQPCETPLLRVQLRRPVPLSVDTPQPLPGGAPSPTMTPKPLSPKRSRTRSNQGPDVNGVKCRLKPEMILQLA